MKQVLICFLLLCSTAAFSQTISIQGTVTDQRDTTGIIGATVMLSPAADSATSPLGTATDIDGNFNISGIQPGTYTLRISYLGYEQLSRIITAGTSDISLGRIRLKPSENVLENVLVQAQQLRAQQLGDTTQFNAGAFKTNPDANADDLIAKMPGITRENGTVKINGEEVKTILVDGKPFFGDDPNMALQNLPAEIIDKVQIFDRLSDQAQFTGHDDGSAQKSINIVTRKGKNVGQFGKVYAGAGADNLLGRDADANNMNLRYQAGGNINFFNGSRRISLIGMSNNINQQNFSSEDLLGVAGGSGGRGRSMRGGRGGGGRGGDAGNFLVGGQQGITTTNSVGLNYSDNWGSRMEVTGSYFFNATSNGNETNLLRQYFSGADSALVYAENSTTRSNNQNHRLNLRLEYNIDSFNSLIITPRFSFQNNDYATDLSGISRFGPDTIGRTTNSNRAHNQGYTFSNTLLYRHRFAKPGRTISLNVNTSINQRSGDGSLLAINDFQQTDTGGVYWERSRLDQRYEQSSNGYTLAPNLTYTEPLSQGSQLMLTYNPSFSQNSSDRQTFDFNTTDNQYSSLNNLLSSKYDNTYNTQRGGLSYRLRQGKINLNAGLQGQIASLQGEQYYPYAFTVDKSFRNLLPNAMINYKFDQSRNLRLMYRTNTNPPSITQLQQVVDISNPLLLRTGNPDLKQDYTHSLSLRYGQTNTATSHNFFVFGMASLVNDYVGNSTLIPTRDTVTAEGIVIRRGSQLSRPVNLDGYRNARLFATYGLPVSAIKSNLNLNAGFNYNRNPALINGSLNLSDHYGYTAGLVLGSNISEELDFTLSYNGGYNMVRNNLQTQSDNTYYSHNASLRFNWIFLNNFVFNTSLNHTAYSGLNTDFNQQFLLWNAYLGYKFLKDRSLEARISAYDILNQNRNIARTITDTYIEDSRTQVLTQYFMFTLTYNLRNFKGAAAPAANEERDSGSLQGGSRGMRPQRP